MERKRPGGHADSGIGCHVARATGRDLQAGRVRERAKAAFACKWVLEVWAQGLAQGSDRLPRLSLKIYEQQIGVCVLRREGCAGLLETLRRRLALPRLALVRRTSEGLRALAWEDVAETDHAEARCWMSRVVSWVSGHHGFLTVSIETACSS